WKMHGSRADNAPLVEAVLGSRSLPDVECVLCPPFVYLSDVARLLRDTPVRLGAQDVCAEAGGAYTGEIAASTMRWWPVNSLRRSRAAWSPSFVWASSSPSARPAIPSRSSTGSWMQYW